MAYAKKAGSSSIDDKFKAISDKVVKLLESGVKPWARPWISPKGGGAFKNIFSEGGYSGCNPMICAIDVMIFNYSSPLFVGFNQAKEKGWSVRKGSKATNIMWGGSYVVEDEEGKESRRSAFKWLPVFNIDTIDDSGSDVKISDFLPDPGAVPAPPVIEDLEQILSASGASIKYGGSEAFYCPSLDSIQLPDRSSFLDSIGFYSTAVHELSHWTGHKDRLNRDKSSYAFEELVAEMGSAMVLSDRGFEQRLESHASYIDSWLSKIKSDPRALFKAMGMASKAANYLLDL